MKSLIDLKAKSFMPGKLTRVLFIFLFLLLCYSRSSAQAWQWIYCKTQPFGIVSFQLFKKPAMASTMGAGLQYYGANFSTSSSLNLHVTGEWHVTTVCGTDIMNIFDFYPPSNMIYNVEILDTLQMPRSIQANSGQLLKGVDNSSGCAGNPVNIGGLKTLVIIQDISIRNVKLTSIQPDGTEVPINYNGTPLNPPTAPNSTTGGNGTTGSTTVPAQNQQNKPGSKAQTLQQQKQAKWDSLQALNQQNQAETKQDVSQLTNIIAQAAQAAQDGNMVGVYVGVGIPVVALTVVALANTTHLAGVAYALGGVAAVYLLIRGDHFNRHWFTMKSQMGIGFEQMPAIANSSLHSNSLTATPQYPYGYFGLKMTFFNNRGISFSLLPYFSHNINSIDKSVDGNEYTYGANGTLLLGKTNTSPARIFLEGGWYQRYLKYTDNTVFEAGNFDYSVLRYGAGIMLWTLNKKGTRESYIKPGIFFEVPSFATSAQPPVMVGNVELMISNAVILEGSYSHNYLIGGDISYPHSITAPGKDFFSIKLIKTSNLF
jgi:hypothetical protein